MTRLKLRFRTLEGPLVPKPPTWPRCGCSKNFEGNVTSCDIIMLKFFRVYQKKHKIFAPLNSTEHLKKQSTSNVEAWKDKDCPTVLSKTNGVIFDAFFSFLCWVSSKPAWGLERNRSADKLGVLDGSWGMFGWKVLEVCLSSVCIISSFLKNS